MKTQALFRLRRSSGFTLIEMAVVITVLGVLVAASIFAYGSWRQRIAKTELTNDLKAVYSAMESAKSWNNEYPVISEGTRFDGNGITKGIFVQSEGVVMTYRSGSASTYCIDATSITRPDISAFLNVVNGNKESQLGLCVSGEQS